MTPAEELASAARIVREYAEKATKNVCPNWLYHAVRHVARNCNISCQHTEFGLSAAPNDGLDHNGWDRYEDSPWIGLMDAIIGEPLAAWFEREAKVVSRRHPLDNNPALTLARVIRQQHAAIQGGGQS